MPAMVSAMVPSATISPAAMMAVEATSETAGAAMTCRRHAHAGNCGNRRNENLVDLHVVTSFFWALQWG
jgi:hypothetical protein